jgi:hypothetical protein
MRSRTRSKPARRLARFTLEVNVTCPYGVSTVLSWPSLISSAGSRSCSAARSSRKEAASTGDPAVRGAASGLP